MNSLLLLGLSALGLALLLTPLVRHMAFHFGLVDQPDHDRKIHGSPVPRLGGIAVFGAVIASYGVLLVVRGTAGGFVWENQPLVVRLLPALIVILGTGITDDLIGLRPWKK